MGFFDRFKKKAAEPAAEPAKRPTPDYSLPPTPDFTLELSSVGLKLMVVEELMYQKGLLQPRFDLQEFASQYPGRNIQPDTEPVGVVPEALDWFARLPIPQELGAQITELNVDMGNDVYVQLIAQYQSSLAEEIAQPLVVKDITATDLTQLPNLSEIQDDAQLLDLGNAALKRLQKRGVEVYQDGELLEPEVTAKGKAADRTAPNYAYQDVADEIVSIIDWHSLGIPPKHEAAQHFKSLDKGLKFTSQWGSNDLGFQVSFLCVYGFADRAIKVGLALGKVPKLKEVYGSGTIKKAIAAGELPPGADKVVFPGLDTAMVVAYYWAMRTGSPHTEQLRKYIFEPDPPGNPITFHPNVLQGNLLRGNAPIRDLEWLVIMSVFGSTSPEWPKQRVDAEIEKTLADWLALPGYEPWSAPRDVAR
ncbi:MAG: hypothetical protein LBR58_10415 [Propionibacteriaceae bacterium]|jgi:hypothetical protein|nr:hypothetical protein [Propionibacteriaceae bacterium]